MIVTLDGMIDSLENRAPDWEDMYRLTERSKRQRDRRLKWRDRWISTVRPPPMISGCPGARRISTFTGIMTRRWMKPFG